MRNSRRLFSSTCCVQVIVSSTYISNWFTNMSIKVRSLFGPVRACERAASLSRCWPSTPHFRSLASCALIFAKWFVGEDRVANPKHLIVDPCEHKSELVCLRDFLPPFATFRSWRLCRMGKPKVSIIHHGWRELATMTPGQALKRTIWDMGVGKNRCSMDDGLAGHWRNLRLGSPGVDVHCHSFYLFLVWHFIDISWWGWYMYASCLAGTGCALSLGWVCKLMNPFWLKSEPNWLHHSSFVGVPTPLLGSHPRVSGYSFLY